MPVVPSHVFNYRPAALEQAENVFGTFLAQAAVPSTVGGLYGSPPPVPRLSLLNSPIVAALCLCSALDIVFFFSPN